MSINSMFFTHSNTQRHQQVLLQEQNLPIKKIISLNENISINGCE